MEESKMRIYVMERGFVMIGEPVAKDTRFITLHRCGIVRKWGTTKGLGQLAIEGIQKDTTIDREPDGVRIAITAIYREIPCAEKAWRKWE